MDTDGHEEPDFVLEDGEEEEEEEGLYMPGLVVPGLFLPIPETDPLNTLLMKYVPDPTQRPLRDVSADSRNKDFHALVMSNSWRTIAKMARDRIVVSAPTDVVNVLQLWYIRLSSLARLRLFNHTSTECANLYTALAATPAATPLIPFELDVLHARTRYWAGDHLGYLDRLTPLLRTCRLRARAAPPDDQPTRAMWTERGTRVALGAASQLVEMRDFTAATRLLAPLASSSPALRSALARVYLQAGHLAAASRHFAAVAADPAADQQTRDMNAALEAAANGQWERAAEVLRGVVADGGDDAVAANNLAVALLSSGKVVEAIEVMEKALEASPRAVTSTEPWLFNLSTLYELRSATTWEKKRDLLVAVAKWSGDGLRTSCLKLPAV